MDPNVGFARMRAQRTQERVSGGSALAASRCLHLGLLLDRGAAGLCEELGGLLPLLDVCPKR
jgi:hypothetical protein